MTRGSGSSEGECDKGDVLVVDDEESIRQILTDKLESDGYCADAASDALRAIHMAKGRRYDLVLLDITMPNMTGIELLMWLKRLDPDLPVVMVTGMESIDLVRRSLREGAYDYLLKPLDFEEFDLTVKRATEQGRMLRENRMYRRDLETKVEERTQQLQDALSRIDDMYNNTILALGSALETRDTETQAHALRVGFYSKAMARELGIVDEAALADIERGAYLHDIGKIGVADRILLKNGPLDPAEWEEMRRHPEIGKDILDDIDFLGGAVDIVYSHHEQFNGSGYPQGLSGQDIPLGARVFAIADTLDAITSDRPYRGAQPFSVAREVISEAAGEQFDPEIAAVFLGMSEEALSPEGRTLRASVPVSPR